MKNKLNAVVVVVMITFGLAFAQAQKPPAAPSKNTTEKSTKAKPSKGLAKKRIVGLSQKATSDETEKPKKSAVLVSGIVSKISVAGNRKIEPDAIRGKLKTKTGESVSEESIRADVQNIFSMGYFYNVEVLQDRVAGGIELTYRVTEKPSIVEIVYRGNERVDKDDLQEASGIKQYTILDQNKIREATDKMSKVYEDKGFFLARIQPKVEDVKAGEEVRLVFDIKENDKVKVKKITFLGNRALPDSKLKMAMQTQEGGFFSWVTSSGGYKQDAFDRDVSVLNFLYFNEGYVQVKIDRPQVYVSPDKKSIFITIRVEEGEQFNVGKVDFAGDLLFTRDELFEATEIHKSGIFVYETLQKDLKSLQFKYGDLGYAFANIIPRTTIREKERLVDITFEIEKGQKVYFGKITVTGNTKTRDKVLRRELKIQEGELYNETRKRQSEENVKRLGFFSDVVFNSSTPPDDPTILNLEIQVKERSTGTIQVGAGFSTVGGFLFQGQVSQANLFGKGQSMGLSLYLNQIGQTYNLSFTEPYFNDTLWSVGGDAYKSDSSRTTYVERRGGADLRLGHPVGEYLNAYLTYKIEGTEVDIGRYTDRSIFSASAVSGITSSLTGSLVFDKRNDRWAPTSGGFASTSIEQAGGVFGGNKFYTKGLANARWYKEIFWGLVFRNNINYGLIRAPDDRLPPFNELFLLGGANSLRGFGWFTVGKKKAAVCCTPDPNNNNEPIPFSSPQLIPYGGSQQFFYQTEIEFPIVTEAQIKGVLFYDIGMADDAIYFAGMRQDAGFGFRWFSPIGPLRFEWGFPLDRLPGEQYSNFEFSIGSPF